MKYYIISYKGSLKGESGEPCKSKYDLSYACKACGTGARLIGNLIAKGLSKVKSDFFETEDYDTLISKEFYEFLLNKNLKIGSLLKVVDSKNNKTNFFHLTSNQFFSIASIETTGLTTERQCQECKRNGFFNEVLYKETPEGRKKIYPPIRLVYYSIHNEFLESSEIFNTWECAGFSNLKAEGMKAIRYARPWIIVSERVKAAFEEYKIKDVKFEKVEIK